METTADPDQSCVLCCSNILVCGLLVFRLELRKFQAGVCSTNLHSLKETIALKAPKPQLSLISVAVHSTTCSLKETTLSLMKPIFDISVSFFRHMR